MSTEKRRCNSLTQSRPSTYPPGRYQPRRCARKRTAGANPAAPATASGPRAIGIGSRLFLHPSSHCRANRPRAVTALEGLPATRQRPVCGCWVGARGEVSQRRRASWRSPRPPVPCLRAARGRGRSRRAWRTGERTSDPRPHRSGACRSGSAGRHSGQIGRPAGPHV